MVRRRAVPRPTKAEIETDAVPMGALRDWLLDTKHPCAVAQCPIVISEWPHRQAVEVRHLDDDVTAAGIVITRRAPALESLDRTSFTRGKVPMRGRAQLVVAHQQIADALLRLHVTIGLRRDARKR